VRSFVVLRRDRCERIDRVRERERELSARVVAWMRRVVRWRVMRDGERGVPKALKIGRVRI
jgi:hypothetical protein